MAPADPMRRGDIPPLPLQPVHNSSKWVKLVLPKVVL
jgi:hypothetical protein